LLSAAPLQMSSLCERLIGAMNARPEFRSFCRLSFYALHGARVAHTVGMSIALRGFGDEVGFTLVEVMVASLLLALSIVAVAELFAISIRNTAIAGNSAFTAILAAQKMEQLRALTWAFDAQGAPVSDSALMSLTPDTLLQDTSGYVDYLDAAGRPLGGSGTLPPGAVYVRRWSIDPLASNPDTTLVIQVLVRRVRGSDPARSFVTSPEEARLMTVRTRKY
jgi:type II secretory pathway pseudopilin PulG